MMLMGYPVVVSDTVHKGTDSDTIFAFYTGIYELHGMFQVRRSKEEKPPCAT